MLPHSQSDRRWDVSSPVPVSRSQALVCCCLCVSVFISVLVSLLDRAVHPSLRLPKCGVIFEACVGGVLSSLFRLVRAPVFIWLSGVCVWRGGCVFLIYNVHVPEGNVPSVPASHEWSFKKRLVKLNDK